jgi:hypothetical protein
LGPQYVAVKGEHGCLLFGAEGQFSAVATLEDIMSHWSKETHSLEGLPDISGKAGKSSSLLKRAVVHGSVLASYNIEAFGLEA